MKKIKKKIAIAVTVALLALPISSNFTLADTGSSASTTTVPSDTTSDSTVLQAAETAVSAYEAAPISTLAEITKADELKAAADTAVAAVTDETAKEALQLRVTHRAGAIAIAQTVLQAEAAVAAYEAAPITTLAEIETAEGLKAAADTAVAQAADVTAQKALELRITNRAEAIAKAKTVLQAEAAVAAYEAAPLTTLAEVKTAEGLKAAADTAVAAVADATTKNAFELRITNRAAAIAKAKALLTPVVDDNGNTVTPDNWLTDLIGKLELALTFDPAQKARLNEKHALAKLAEAQKLMEANKPEEAQNCLNEYSDKITQAQAFLEQVKDPTSDAAKKLAQALVNVNSNNVQVLGSLLDKLPPQAAQKLALNVVRSMDKAVQKMDKEDAKNGSNTTSATTTTTTPATTSPTPSATTPANSSTTDNETLKKQAQVALENFKKSLNQKGLMHIEDQDLDQDQDQDHEALENEQMPRQTLQSQSPQIQNHPSSQPTHVTVTSIKPHTVQGTAQSSKLDKQARNKGEENGKKKGEDDKEGMHEMKDR